MGTATKCMKFLEESEIELEDRLSNLPENLTSHILTFLPTKYAVGTSALSTFWKNQWTSCPNLDFDDTMLIKTPKLIYDTCVKTSFENFIHRVLDLHKAPQICNFRLRCHKTNLPSHLNAWVSNVLERNVQKLELFLCFKLMGPLPCEILTSLTLVELRLGRGFVLDIPTLVRLPNLRVMYLEYIKFTNKESSERLFSSCPVLEDLAIISCIWDDTDDSTILNISSPTVKRLTVGTMIRSQITIVINTPRLEHLNYFGQLADRFLLKSPEFLAKVCLHKPSHPFAIEPGKVLAQGISNVQSLYLSGEILESLQKSRAEVQPFCNVRTLAFGYNRNGAWQMLPLLLDKCPNLKHLELNDGLYGRESHEEYFIWDPPKVVPACLLLHLERITVYAFKRDGEEMKMIKYLLVNSKVLRKLNIKCGLDAQEQRIVRKRLLQFAWAKGLRDCEVVVS